MKRIMDLCILSAAMAALIAGCSSSKPDLSGSDQKILADCPDRPNCVSSQAIDKKYAIEPLRLKGNAAEGWNAILSMVDNLPRTRIVTATEQYLHAECKSRFLGFIDDLELLLDPETGIISVRSASRVGFYDLGVNRRRIQALRKQLEEFFSSK